jgi:hypothetical protein
VALPVSVRRVGMPPSCSGFVNTHTAWFVRHYHECLSVQQYWYCCTWGMFGTVRGFHVRRDLKKKPLRQRCGLQNHKKLFHKPEKLSDKPFL